MLSQKKTDRLDHGNTTMTLSEPPAEQWERNTNTKQNTSFPDLSTAALISKPTQEEFRCPELAGWWEALPVLLGVVLGHFLFPLPVWSSCAWVCTLFAYCSWSHRHNNSTRAFTEQTYPKAKKKQHSEKRNEHHKYSAWNDHFQMHEMGRCQLGCGLSYICRRYGITVDGFESHQYRGEACTNLIMIKHVCSTPLLSFSIIKHPVITKSPTNQDIYTDAPLRRSKITNILYARMQMLGQACCLIECWR